MTTLTESLHQLIRENINIFYDMNENGHFVELSVNDYIDFLPINDLNRFVLKPSENFHYETEIQIKCHNKAIATLTFNIGDKATTNWLTNGQNVLFEGLTHFATCKLSCQFDPNDYGRIFGSDYTCKINVIPSFEFDIDKLRCFASYIDFYHYFDGPKEQKRIILNRFFSQMLADSNYSSKSLDQMREKICTAKLLNDPLYLRSSQLTHLR